MKVRSKTPQSGTPYSLFPIRYSQKGERISLQDLLDRLARDPGHRRGRDVVGVAETVDRFARAGERIVGAEQQLMHYPVFLRGDEHVVKLPGSVVQRRDVG